MRRTFIAVLCLAFWPSIGQTASSGRLQIVDLDGNAETSLYGINSNGQIVGVCNGSFFILEKDGTTVPWTPPGIYAYPIGINDRGDVAGYSSIGCETGGTCTEGFLRSADGTVSTFFASGQSNDETTVEAFNSRDQIAGYFYDASYHLHGFIRQPDGTVEVIDAPNAGYTNITALNDRGYAAGMFADDSGWHGILVAPNGKQTVFDVPTTQFFLVTGINDDGAITGWYEFNNNTQETAFVRSPDGAVALFSVDGAAFSNTVAIDKSGDITGTYSQGKYLPGYVRSASGEISTFEMKHAGMDPTGINSRGVIVGTATIKHRIGLAKYYGFIWRP